MSNENVVSYTACSGYVPRAMTILFLLDVPLSRRFADARFCSPEPCNTRSMSRRKVVGFLDERPRIGVAGRGR